MKKSIRVLSVVLALSMLAGIFSVFGYAANDVTYPKYKGSAIASQYNDIDKPVLTTAQYGAMALDEVDRMLTKENIKLTKADIYVGDVDITSVNATFSSVCTLVNSADQLLPLLGDAGDLDITDLWYDKSSGAAKQRATSSSNGNTTDVGMLSALIGFVDTNIGLVKKFVNGSFSLGFLDSVIPDIDVNILLRGLLYGIMNDDFDSDEDTLPKTYTQAGGLDVMVEDLLIWAMLGDYSLVDGEYVLNKNADGSSIHEGLIWAYFEKIETKAEQDEVISDLKIVSTNKNAYTAIEDILVDAFNYVAVPELNTVTRPWLRETCGIVYDKDKMDEKSGAYEEGYDGEPYDEEDLDPQLAPLFDLENMAIPVYDPASIPAKYNVSSSNTFIDNFNNFLGYALTKVLAAEQKVCSKDEEKSADYTSSYDWVYTGNSALLTNIANVARLVLNKSGDKFFADYIDIPESYTSMTAQQIYAFVIRAIFNGSVDWMYIGDDCQTLADVLYEAAVQMAWQDIPQCQYTKPTQGENETEAAYFERLLNAGLNIMMDIAVYNLNKVFDTVPTKIASKTSPASEDATDTKYIGKNGLLHYCGDWEAIGIQLAVWGVHNYGAFLTASGASLSAVAELVDVNDDGTVGSTTAADVWEGIDYVLNALIPISSTIEAKKGDEAEAVWLYGEIAGQATEDGQSDVVRSLIFDYLAMPLLNLDATNIAKIFMKNSNGAFANNTVKTVLVKLVTRIINAIFPGTITQSYATLDAILQNSELGDIAGNLIHSFYTYIDEWAEVALPIVCEVLSLSTAQEFDQMDSYMGSIYSASKLSSGVTFTIVNGSSGINTAYTNDLGTRTQDNLYVYELNLDADKTFVKSGTKTGSITISGLGSGNTLEGGSSAKATISGSSFSQGDVVEVTICYKVKVEDDSYLNGGQELSCTRFAYVGSSDKDDSEITTAYPTSTAGFNLYAAPAVYSTGSLSSIANYSVQVERLASVGQVGTGSNYNMNAVISVDNTNAPFIELDTDDNTVVTQNADGENTTSGCSPLKVAEGYVALDEKYTKISVTGDGYSQISFNSKKEFVNYEGVYCKKIESTNDEGETEYTYIPVYVEDSENEGEYVPATVYNANTKYYQATVGSYVNHDGVMCKKDGDNYYPLYVQNDYRLYDAVASGAEFDPTESYYTYSTNVVSTDSNGNKLDKDGNIIVEPGTYSFTVTMSVPDTAVPADEKTGTAAYTINGYGSTTSVTVKAIIYKDYSLPSLYSNAANSNLQEADLTGSYTTAWINYTTALDTAAKLVLAPKTCANYDVSSSSSTIKSTNANYNYSKFAEVYDQLADAKEAVEEFKATAGVDTLVSKRAEVLTDNSYYIYYANGVYSLTEGGESITLKEGEHAGWNEIEYYETADDNSVERDYCFYNYRNYVPHTYSTYREALNTAEELIDKRAIYPPVEPEVPDNASAYEYSQYLEERDAYEVQLAAYEEAKANPVAIDPVEVAYASHMLTLTGGRLLDLDGHKDALAIAIEKWGNISATGNSYSAKTWNAYTTAVTFANKVNAEDYEATPYEITTALSELICAAKKLNQGVDTANLAAALATLEETYLGENEDATQARVDSDLFARTLNAVSDAENIIASDLSYSTSNVERVADALAEINTLMELLAGTSGSTEITGAGNGKDVVTYDSYNDTLPSDMSKYDETLGYWPFHSTNWTYNYYPVMTNYYAAAYDEENTDGVSDALTSSGYDEFKYVMGVGPDQGDGSVVADIVTIPEGYTAVWNPDEQTGAFGSGSYITVYDSSDVAVDTIYVVIYGDLNGDGSLTGDDTGVIDDVNGGNEDLLWGHELSPVYASRAIAASICGSVWDYASSDNAFAIDVALTGSAEILQMFSEEGLNNGVSLVVYSE